jgi:NTE family protein
VAADLFRLALASGGKISGVNRQALEKLQKKLHAPFNHWTSLTSAFQQALQRRLFGNTVLTDNRRDDLNVVFNACELRTGSAFRFGSDVSGCWRFGSLASNAVPVSLAVATSAAYPILLPAIDRTFEFKDKKGDNKSHRMVLTDGGIFDNLGITCLEPGRSREFSLQAPDLDYILCCDAGQGLYDDNVYPYYWRSRMTRSFEAVYRKANDAARARLFSHVESGKLKGFFLSYLGQMHSALPYIPPDLVRREEVYRYPTNFSPMSAEDIDKLSERGEQLTRLLITRYCPEL